MMGDIFARAAPHLRAALDDVRPLFRLQDIAEMLCENRAKLWSGNRSCILTQVHDYPTGERVLEGWLAGGDMQEMIAARPLVEMWARDAGCTQIHVTGRDGWARVLASAGYEPYTRTVRKVLSDG